MTKKKPKGNFFLNLLLSVVMSKNAREIFFRRQEQKRARAEQEAKSITTVDDITKVRGEPLDPRACTLVEQAVRQAKHDIVVDEAMAVHKQKQKLFDALSEMDRKKMRAIANKVMSEAVDASSKSA